MTSYTTRIEDKLLLQEQSCVYEFYLRIQRRCGLEIRKNAPRVLLIESLLGTDALGICVQMAADLDLVMKSSLLSQSGLGGQLSIRVELDALANAQIAAAALG